MKKSQQIYHYIRTRGIRTKQDMMIDLGLSLPTITQNLRYLEEQHLIDASGKLPSRGERGRNATAYAYVPEARAAIGVYLTGHHINVVALDLSGKVIHMLRERFEFALNDEAYLRKIGENVETVKAAAHITTENLLGVGISVPGLVTEDGELVTYGRTLGFTDSTREQIARYIPYPNRLFHDSIVAGYAEVWVSPELSDAFYISLSNSVGGAFVHNKDIYQGISQKCGEIGHMTVVPSGGEQCYCGRSGCFDTVCRSTLLDQYTDGNLEDFFRLLAAQDDQAMQLWDRYLDHLALGIHNIKMLFDSAVIIGGYVGAYIEPYMAELCRRVDERDAFTERAQEFLFPCRYKIEACAAGAAICLIDKFFEEI